MLHLPDRDVSFKMLPDRDASVRVLPDGNVSVKVLPDRDASVRVLPDGNVKIVTCRAKDLGTPRSCLKLLDDPDILSNRKPARN